jgi:Ca-activated chloride channel family protein
MQRTNTHALAASSKQILFLSIMTIAVTWLSEAVANQREEKTSALDEIVVTGSFRVTAGGNKDANFFRGEVIQERIPHPDSITAEGLFSGYDLQLQSKTQCAKLFCLIGESMPVDLIAQRDADILVGLSFATNLDAAKWHRPPLNLVAVVDKSGSMNGQPLALVRHSLQQVVKHMEPSDQLSIVLYGDRSHVHLPPTKIAATSKAALSDVIRAIQSAGSTNMESGLRLGYQVADESGRAFNGTTRVMLFTDEQPNVGATDAESFMGMAIAASKQGVGLTTIGVGVQFDAALATKISSSRGGNSFFMRDEKDVESLFATEFDTMVSELAHDVTIEITPNAGYRVAAVYGVPGELLAWQDKRSVTLTIPTVFLSTKGGGIFVALGRDTADKYLPKPLLTDLSLASVDLRYRPLSTDESVNDSLRVSAPATTPSKAMRTAAMLVDEFTVLREALNQFHVHNDTKAAYRVLTSMKSRLSAASDLPLKPELETVGTLEARMAFLSGYSSEGVSKHKSARLWGKWQVYRREGQVSIYGNDVIEFTPDDEFRITRGKAREGVEDEEESYSANNDQILLNDSELLFEYDVNYRNLVLSHERSGARIYARRLVREESATR